MIEKISPADTLFIPLEKQTLTNRGTVTKEVVRIADDTLSTAVYTYDKSGKLLETVIRKRVLLFA
tara:strand:+ start:1119 stop:1313 length:195 start_codon:yes stop_codon:yes gene_type:complete